MSSKIREYQSILYILGAAVALTVFAISANDLIFHNSFLLNNSISLKLVGSWIYWIFAITLTLSGILFYMYYKVVEDIRKFQSLINSSSKHIFIRNLKELEEIARHLGKKYVFELEEKKQRWKV